VSLPAADELFRPTGPAQDEALAGEAALDGGAAQGSPASPAPPSGRVRHDEKMTVYVTADELLDLEQARLTLRRLGMGVDRGRLVRAAIAMALADLHDHGEDSAVVHRLKQA
jgi:hypothetical protein